MVPNTSEQVLADPYYDFEIVNMKSLQDWIVYMLTIPSWYFLAKNIQNHNFQNITSSSNIRSLGNILQPEVSSKI